MKAEETVIDSAEITMVGKPKLQEALLRGELKICVEPLLKQQAQISFQAGIKEVVEWIKENATMPSRSVQLQKRSCWTLLKITISHFVLNFHAHIQYTLDTLFVIGKELRQWLASNIGIIGLLVEWLYRLSLISPKKIGYLYPAEQRICYFYYSTWFWFYGAQRSLLLSQLGQKEMR